MDMLKGSFHYLKILEKMNNKYKIQFPELLHI